MEIEDETKAAEDVFDEEDPDVPNNLFTMWGASAADEDDNVEASEEEETASVAASADTAPVAETPADKTMTAVQANVVPVDEAPSDNTAAYDMQADNAPTDDAPVAISPEELARIEATMTFVQKEPETVPEAQESAPEEPPAADIPAQAEQNAQILERLKAMRTELDDIIARLETH